MPGDQLRAFLEKISSDEELKSKVKKIPEGPEGVGPLIELGKEWGYEFSEQDLVAAMKAKVDSGEIPQEDLDAVSGGGMFSGITKVLCTLSMCQGL